ncbi:hypothetical protein BZG35_02890 [Brevundimonas sp. LM2]|uniref:hypothetical protein n=1 Tax=Brevundimonas sp. LM2 TaxID=1938605 RepID=UPI000983EAE7|nr:hypothetical protein [Brevundimonas sp. LM2]AQR60715.1 hypothetical protein BZG35_02890 [Brevundimonas sp. LM2]
MIRNTLLMAAAATALMAAPALAQDATGQTPPSSTTSSPTASSPAAPARTPSAATPAPSGTIQLQPGASVKGSDGATLGTLEGVRNNDAGEQELTVRGTDGQLRGVPLAGLTQQGADVVVGWSAGEYSAAPAIADSAADSPSPAPAPASSPADPTSAAEPTSSDAGGEAEPATPPA